MTKAELLRHFDEQEKKIQELQKKLDIKCEMHVDYGSDTEALIEGQKEEIESLNERLSVAEQLSKQLQARAESLERLIKQGCPHNVEHKEVLGYVLCVCCEHCQRKAERYERVLNAVEEDHYENHDVLRMTTVKMVQEALQGGKGEPKS